MFQDQKIVSEVLVRAAHPVIRRVLVRGNHTWRSLTIKIFVSPFGVKLAVATWNVSSMQTGVFKSHSMQLLIQSKAQAKLDSASLHHNRPTLASSERAMQKQI